MTKERSRLARPGSSILILSVVALTVCVTAFLIGCRSSSADLQRNVDIVSRSSISGSVNGMLIDATVVATLNTGRGGHSTCTFSTLPSGFNPATLSTHMWSTHHTAAGLGRDIAVLPAFNLYDLTAGNYRVLRTVTYPDFPQSKVVFETTVKATQSEWSTQIHVTGTYDGPRDVRSVRDYTLSWTTDGKTLLEQGSATLVLSSGDSVRSVWSSSITPDNPDFSRFPREGETINVSFSPFAITGNKMSYDWHGTVSVTGAQRKYEH